MLVKHQSTNRFFYLRLFFLQTILLCLVACNLQSNNDAPVSNGWEDTSHTESTYRVGQGETLYSIAWRYGLDFRQLVAINHFQPPYHIHEGQIIKVVPDNSDDTSSTYVSVVSTTDTITPPAMVYNNNTYKPTIPAVPTAIPTGPQQQNKPLNNTIANGPTTVTATSTATLTTEQAGTPINMDYTNGPVSSWLWPVRGKVIDNYTGSTGFNKGIDIAGYRGEPIHATASGRVVYCGNGLRGYGQLIIIKHNGANQRRL